MCGQMSLAFCNLIRVMARSWARTGHVAVWGPRSLGDGRRSLGPFETSFRLVGSLPTVNESRV